MDESPVESGTVLAGKYRVERVLGSGGMGVVVAAVHIDLGQRVAIKFLLQRAVENGEAASRFIREARAAVKIESEHVARVLDVGRLDSGAPFLVMEYLDGRDLAAHAGGQALPIEEAVDFVLQACGAMAVAHAAGIIHRDLKPANLFVTRRPDGSSLLKVLDFGISKMSLLDAPAVLTHTSAIMGSPLYMSPEQAQSARTVDSRTDIWSLGVILYELLTGKLPFPGETLTEVLTALMTATPIPVRSLRPDVPEGLANAVMRALEKSLERRFANIGELSAAIVEFAPPASRMLHDRVSGVLIRAGISSAPPPSELSARGIPSVRATSAAPPAPVAKDAAPMVSATDTNWVERGKPTKAGVRRPLLVAVGVLLSVGAGALLFARRQAPPSSATSEPSVAPAAALPPSVIASAPLPPPAAPSDVAGGASIQADAATPSATSPSASRLKPSGAARSAPALAQPSATAPAVSAVEPSARAARKKNPLSIDFK